MPDFDHAYAELPNGMRLHYVSAGAGPLVLFVHGFPEFWYEWKDQLKEFARDHRAVALDMRGHNLSSKPPVVEDYRARHLIEDLRLLIDHLGGKPCVVVAHDWGGAVAWSFAAKHPEYLTRLVILNAPHAAIFARELRNNPAQRAASAYMNLFRSGKAERVLSENGYARLSRMTLDSWAANGAHVTEDDRRAYTAAWSQPGALTASLNFYRASPLHPPEPGQETPVTRLDLDPTPFQVPVPTLVIWGERDEALLTGNLEGLDAHVANLHIQRVADASHWIVHEKPALVSRLIRDFISGREVSGL
jgi:pimeloyl-ACP methyl ester carboxylesterase